MGAAPTRLEITPEIIDLGDRIIQLSQVASVQAGTVHPWRHGARFPLIAGVILLAAASVRGGLGFDELTILGLAMLALALAMTVLGLKRLVIATSDGERVLIVGFRESVDFMWPEGGMAMRPLSDLLEPDPPARYWASEKIRASRQKLHQPGDEPTIWHENKSGNVSKHPYSCALRAGASYNYLLVDGERRLTERELLRLQCYDGLEQREALYEWNYAAQLLHMRAAELRGPGSSSDEVEREVYQDRYLIRRPLLAALQAPEPGAVLLIDEVDRADEPFEAFLLEYLGEYQVSIPEIGTVRATAMPVTILTSNRTRDLNDAVKRRCLYHWLDYPDRERELAIIRAQVPGASEALSAQVAEVVGRLRSAPFANAFARAPGIAESVEWAKALVALDTLEIDPELVSDTAGILFKQREDVAALTADMATALLKPESEGS